MIAVAGASGFVGRAVCAALAEHAVPLRAVRGAVPSSLLDAADVVAAARRGPGWEALCAELRDVDALVNAAGAATPDSTDTGALHLANVILPRVLAAAAADAGVRRFVHVSSAAVQGSTAELDESEVVVVPGSAYARSKADGERAVLDDPPPGLDVVVYRPASVLGVGRAALASLLRLSRLPVVPLPDPDAPVPTALVANVGAAAAFLASAPGPLPSVVMHPSEGMSIRRLLTHLGGASPPRIVAVPGGKLLERSLRAASQVGRLAGPARRVELLVAGQAQAPSSLTSLGFEAPVGEEGYGELARPIEADRPLRIVYVLTRSDTVGGAAVHVGDLAATLTEAGHTVRALIGGDGLVADRMRERGIDVRSVPHLRREISPPDDLRAVVELIREFRSFAPDLVSTHSSKAGLAGRAAAFVCRVPALFTAHGWAFTDGVPAREAALFRRLERAAGPLSARIVCVSHNDDAVAERARVGRGRRVVVHNGVRDVAARARPEVEPVEVVSVARFDDQKDHPTLLAALGQIDGVHLTLVGDGPRQAKIERLARELEVDDRVRFLGLRDDVADILAGGQIYALVSNWEGLPRSILEAMRAGLPVIASDVGGVTELVDERNGVVVPRGDVDAVASALRDLASDPGRRRALGEAGRERFEQGHSMPHLLSSTLSVYEDVLGRPVTSRTSRQ